MSTDPVNTQLLQLVTQQQSQIAAMQQQLGKTHEEAVRVNNQISDMSWMVSVLMQHHQTQVAEEEQRVQEARTATREAPRVADLTARNAALEAELEAVRAELVVMRGHLDGQLGDARAPRAEPQPGRGTAVPVMHREHAARDSVLSATRADQDPVISDELLLRRAEQAAVRNALLGRRRPDAPQAPADGEDSEDPRRARAERWARELQRARAVHREQMEQQRAREAERRRTAEEANNAAQMLQRMSSDEF